MIGHSYWLLYKSNPSCEINVSDSLWYNLCMQNSFMGSGKWTWYTIRHSHMWTGLSIKQTWASWYSFCKQATSITKSTQLLPYKSQACLCIRTTLIVVVVCKTLMVMVVVWLCFYYSSKIIIVYHYTICNCDQKALYMYLRHTNDLKLGKHASFIYII